MTSNLVNYSRRQLHTIVSREIIKPFTPTPSHLKTHNLSLIDQLAPDAYMPMVIFYPNSNIHSSSSTVKIAEMRNSLSQTLTHYYPFAGRLNKTTPSSIDCNDEGIEFVEAFNDKPLSNFLQNMKHDQELSQLFPNGLIWKRLGCYNIEIDQTACPLAVQVNSFTCGGIAVAVSLSHKVADASSLCHFFKDWATLTSSRLIMGEKYVSPIINPSFISFKNASLNFQGFAVDKSLEYNCVTKSFMFPGSKLNELKRWVITMTTMESGQPIMNPTRVEVLNWLLYKCAVEAATKNSTLGSLSPTGLVHAMNLRNKMIKPLPETSIGNYVGLPRFPTLNPNETSPGSFIGRLKKLKMECQGIPDIQTVAESLSCMSSKAIQEEEQRKFDDWYVFTSMCRYPIYSVDFGWGKPIKATIAGTVKNNWFVAMDAPDGDGIEALVSLKKQDMEIFQEDPHLLSFVKK